MPNRKKIINREQFEKLCEIQCTGAEIRAVLNCNSDTLCKWCKETYGMTFEDAYANFRQSGNASLRRTQWEMAKKVPSMAIFLGKQYLGQKDKPDDKQDTSKVDDIVNALNRIANGES